MIYYLLFIINSRSDSQVFEKHEVMRLPVVVDCGNPPHHLLSRKMAWMEDEG